jgi:hypothetical protein
MIGGVARLSSYDVDAAFMSFQAHESGIHAVWPGCWRGQGDGSPFPVHDAAGGEARADHDQAVTFPERSGLSVR